jgi:hypothetical protein
MVASVAVGSKIPYFATAPLYCFRDVDTKSRVWNPVKISSLADEHSIHPSMPLKWLSSPLSTG